MRKVIIESPFMGNKERTRAQHVDYARMAVRDSVLRGEAPIASHLLLTQKGILDDDVPDERTMGMEAGLAWMDVADASIFYVDCGWSSGMKKALERCEVKENYVFEKRSLFQHGSLVSGLGVLRVITPWICVFCDELITQCKCGQAVEEYINKL